MQVSFQVNGQARSVDVEPDTPLLWILREHLGLMGTKYGCGVAEVDLDDSGARSIVPAVANALHDLTGVRLRHLLLNAERVLAALA